MFRFFPSIIVLQLVLTIVMYGAIYADTPTAYLAVVAYILVAGLLFSFWLKTLSILHNKEEVSMHKEKFAKEREELRVDAEREKLKVVKDTHKQVQKEANKTHAKANFKVGAAVAGAVGVGVLLVVGQMVTLGLLTLTTAGGGLAGYILRARQEKKMLPPGNINVQSSDTKLPKPKIIDGISYEKNGS